MTTVPTSRKPLLRGYFHQEAFFVALGASLLLIARAQTTRAQLACAIYGFSLLVLFGVSAVYHRFHWKPQPRQLMRRLDHSAIFILIAGTMTPVVLLALPPERSPQLIAAVWLVAAAGILRSIFWTGAPKVLNAVLYVIAGWMLFPYLGQIEASIGASGVALLVVGGILYSVGALFYALKAPKLFPKTFGYHELFHVFTIAAAAAHFIVIYRLVANSE